MSEFIGARISLISKSDIKYVGTLHEINSENSTVALENVKSFGTEGRKGAQHEEIPPSDQIYEYIVFRGSDVKDLTIIEQPQEQKPQPQMPNDPAILGSARPPQHPPQGTPQGPATGPGGQQWRGPPPPQNFSPYGGYPPEPSRFAPPGGPHGFPGAPGAVPGYGPGPGPNFGGPQGPPPPGWFPPPQHGFPQPPPTGPGGPGGPPGFQQQQGQPSAPNGPSPLQENQRPGPKQQPPRQGPAQPPPLPTDSKPTELSATPASSTAETAPPLPNQSKPDKATPTEPRGQKGPAMPGNPRVAVPLSARSNAAAAKTTTPAQPPNAQQSTQSATQAAAAAVAAAMAKLGPAQSKTPGQQASGETTETLAQKIGNLSTSDGRGRGNQRGGPPSRGARGPRRGGPTRTGVEVPTTDFDFESSNAKFNKQDLVKEAIASGSPAGTPDEGSGSTNGLNGHGKTEDDEVVIPGATTKKYDKGTSFFDNLSSELKDRQTAEQTGNRLVGSEFRSEERKRNMETFGESNPFRGRGGYRGRGYGTRGGGRGYGRGRGGFAPRGAAGTEA